LLVPAVKRPSYATVNPPSHNSVGNITPKHFIHVPTVALHNRPTRYNPTQPHSHSLSPAITNSAPLCTHCTGFIGFSATNPFVLSIT